MEPMDPMATKARGGEERRREGAREMCKVKNCNRTSFSEGLCGFHALQGYYRARAAPGVGLTADRVEAPSPKKKHPSAARLVEEPVQD